MFIVQHWALALATAILLLAGAPGAAAQSPSPIASAATARPGPPGPPAMGPGSEEMDFFRVIATHYGEAKLGYWIFEPADPLADSATPAADEGRPVVLFLSGCCGDPPLLDSCPPECHANWIDHLVHRGAIVIFPIMRGDHGDEDVVSTMRAAVTELTNGGHARPDFGRFAVFGWSFGGDRAANYAAMAAQMDLPEPAAVMIVSPGCENCGQMPLSQVPSTTRVLVVVSTDDDLVTEDPAKTIWAGLTQVPLDHRDYVRIGSDDHGSPPLVAHHQMAGSGPDWASLDALDWYGLWKPLDALLACTFSGESCDVAFGNTPQQRYMGTWSDGVPVKEAEVTDDPGPPAT
jgi:acetyl esterase/lipase